MQEKSGWKQVQRDRVTDSIPPRAAPAHCFLASELLPKPHSFPQNVRVFAPAVGFCLEAPRPLTKATASRLRSGLGSASALCCLQRVVRPQQGCLKLGGGNSHRATRNCAHTHHLQPREPLCLFVCSSLPESMFPAAAKAEDWTCWTKSSIWNGKS